MPKASAPIAPCVAVWLSPQTIVMPGWLRPCSGPMMWTMPWSMLSIGKYGTPNSLTLRSSVSTCSFDSGLVDAGGAGAAVGRRDVVVGDRHRRIGTAHLAAGELQPLEGLRRRDLVDQVKVDIDQVGAFALRGDDVVVPDLVEQRARRGHGFLTPRDCHRARRRSRRRRGAAFPGARCRGRVRRCAPLCRCGRADNRAWPGARRRGGPLRSR